MMTIDKSIRLSGYTLSVLSIQAMSVHGEKIGTGTGEEGNGL